MPENQVQEPKAQQQPLGLTANPNNPPVVTQEQFFHLMRVSEALNNLLFLMKQENLQADTIRYYFEEDLVDAKDDKGNVILIKDKEGKDVPQKSLTPDFWSPKVEQATS